MSTVEQRLRLANLIEQVLNGEISSGDALRFTREWSDFPWKEKQIDDAQHRIISSACRTHPIKEMSRASVHSFFSTCLIDSANPVGTALWGIGARRE